MDAGKRATKGGRPTAFLDPWAGTDLDIYKSNMSGFLREIRQSLEPEGLLLTDLRALRVIRERPSRPTEVAARLELTPAAGTQLIDRLERYGLVRRSPDPSDRRATVVRLTPSGARRYLRAARRVRRVVVEVAEGMSPTGLAALREGSDELARVLRARSGA